jgi:hypothetical protein
VTFLSGLSTAADAGIRTAGGEAINKLVTGLADDAETRVGLIGKSGSGDFVHYGTGA